MAFEVFVLGVGDAFSAHHHPACLLLHCDGTWLGIDCPDSYPAVLSQAGEKSGRKLDLDCIHDFVITHVHGDHMNGLEAVGFYNHFVQNKRLDVHTTKEVREVLWEHRLKGSMGVLMEAEGFKSMTYEDYYQGHLLENNHETQIGPFSLRIKDTRHHVPTIALLIRAQGKILGYSGDTAFDPSLIQFLSQADLIVHETNLGLAHTPYSALQALPEDIRRRMRLIHYPDGFDKVQTDIPVLSEGDVLQLAAP